MGLYQFFSYRHLFRLIFSEIVLLHPPQRVFIHNVIQPEPGVRVSEWPNSVDNLYLPKQCSGPSVWTEIHTDSAVPQLHLFITPKGPDSGKGSDFISLWALVRAVGKIPLVVAFYFWTNGAWIPQKCWLRSWEKYISVVDEIFLKVTFSKAGDSEPENSSKDSLH